MKKRNLMTLNNSESSVKTGRLDDACARYGLGRTTMRQLAAEAGAVVHVGKCYLVNYSVLDKWMDAHADMI